MQYLDLMLLFGLPLFAWYGPVASTIGGDKRSPQPRWAFDPGAPGLWSARLGASGH